ncbi:MAG: hypothetical protein ACHQDD_08780 [Steroidobacterales bacterium]
MGSDQLQALAREIVSQTIQHTWGYWLVLAVLLLVVNYAGSWLGSFAAKRGEHRAVDADLRRILGQLRQTTRVTEGIRSVVAMGEWSERERRTLRRTKLEELLLTAHKARVWLKSEQDRLVFLSGDRETPSPQPMMVTIGKLYFPDLRQLIFDFDIACDQYHLMLMNINQDLLQAKMAATAEALAQYGADPQWEIAAQHASHTAHTAIRERRNEEILDGNRRTFQALLALDQAAAAVMATIVDAPADAGAGQQ